MRKILLKKVKLLFAVLAMLLVLPVMANSERKAVEIAVSGTVVSSDDGAGLPGVSVLVKGTTNGTTTDANGKYSINVPDGNSILVFSFIGYRAQEVSVAGRTTASSGCST